MKHHTVLRISVGLVIAFLSIAAVVYAAATISEPPLPDVVEADGRMGTGYTFWEFELPPRAFKAGSRWDRVDVRWNQIDTSPGEYDFGPHENIIDRDKANGIDFIGILGSPALWATNGCQNVSSIASRQSDVNTLLSIQSYDGDDWWWRACPPVNLYLPWSDPNNYWADYVHDTVSYFKDKVQVWEMWNEPDYYDVFWTGSAAEYAQLLKIGYLAAKDANPNAIVLMAGMAYWSDINFYKSVLNELVLLDPGGINNYFFDAFSLHLYSDVYTIGPVVDNIRFDMSNTVGLHPVWLTEIGVPLWDEHPSHPGQKYDNSATIEEAGAFVIQAYAESRAAGIERFIFFRMHDEDMGEAFGLMRNDLTLRPSYVAYQVAARYLQGENQISGPFNANGVRRITYWGTSRGKIDILWNTQGGSAVEYAHPAVLPSATLIDKRGQTQILNNTNGVFTLTLAAATANTGVDGKYIIGGDPVLLVQEDTDLPTSAMHALPAVTHGSQITLSWDIADAHAGPWYLEVEQAATSTGPWTPILGWGQTQDGVTQATLSGQVEGDWHFRARARDNVGNWEDWPTSSEVWTTVNLHRTVSISLTTYIDANSNNTKDPGEGPPIQNTSMVMKTSTGDVVAQITGNTWEYSQSLLEGNYLIQIQSTGMLPESLQFYVRAGGDIMVIEDERGLKPVSAEVFVPLLLRD